MRVSILFTIKKAKPSQEANTARLWFSEWPAVNGFYWLRGWRHYGDLPISVDGDSFWMMFNLAKSHRTDLDDSEDVQFLGPITPYSAVTAATAMRSACVAKVKKMAEQWRQEASKAGRMFSDKAAVATKIADELESLTLQEQKQT